MSATNTRSDRPAKRRWHRLFLAGLASMMVMVTGVAIDPGTAQASGWFKIRNQHSGKCLTVDPSGADGTQIVQKTCWWDQPQHFTFHYQGMGHYSVKSTTTGKCIDVAGSHDGWGNAVVQNTCTFSYNQSMLIGRNPNTNQNQWWTYRTWPQPELCLDVAGWGQDDGVGLVQWPCHSGSNQTFEKLELIIIK